jgi:uncharacterized YigZ family protein
MAEKKSVQRIILRAGSSDVEAKKSPFLGELRSVGSEEEAKAFIEEVRKKHYDARHHCFAMRIGTPGSVFERSGDDGEPQGTAGKPMLEILKGAELYDVCAVVTRYFGGTLLGTGGLVRAYSDSLKEALQDSELAEVVSGILMRIECSYSLAEKIRRAAQNQGIHILKEEYGAECALHCLMRENEADSFRKKVTELSNGSVTPETTGTVLFADGEKPLLYGPLPGGEKT